MPHAESIIEEAALESFVELIYALGHGSWSVDGTVRIKLIFLKLNIELNQ